MMNSETFSISTVSPIRYSDVSAIGRTDVAAQTSRITAELPANSNGENQMLATVNTGLSSFIGCLGILDNAVVLITMATSKKMRSKVTTEVRSLTFL